MTFAGAAKFVMPWGKHAGRTLDAIASDDTGLRYLDWLRDLRREDNSARIGLDEALDAYLDDPAIQKELNE
jgi:uncharacterized protein (DUF3820 family)